MQISLKCPYCDENMEYFKDEAMEKLDWYSFNCSKCQDSFLVPKNNPLIEIKE